MSDRIVKLVLMTKNEKYLIKHWVKYHGDIFGYENLHLIDDSDDPEILQYYQYLMKIGVHIYRNNTDMTNLEDYINFVFNEIKGACDFLIKLDTDEFIGHYNVETNKVSICKHMIRNIFNSIPIDGHKYKCSFTMNSLPLEGNDDPLSITNFSQPWRTTFKSFFHSNSFLRCDLGSHSGLVLPPCDSNLFIETNLIIIHYHHQRCERFIENSRKVLVSHKYIDETDDYATQINKLSHLASSSVNSIHKIHYYLDYLSNPQNYITNYYENFKNTPNPYQFNELCNTFINKKKKCIIITTINEPTEQIIYYTKVIGWDLIVVGDSKTNDASYKNIDCIYLGLDEQQSLFPSIYNKIPLKSYTRKMFGYLYAIKNKYEIIYDTDDDNQYIGSLDFFNNNFTVLNNVDLLGNDLNISSISKFESDEVNASKIKNSNHFTFNKINGDLFIKNTNLYTLSKFTNGTCISGIFRDNKLCSQEGFVNIYKIYTDEHIWPRGIPPNHESILREPDLGSVPKNTSLQCVVIQGLVNNDPDVDAYYRINVNNNPFNFEIDPGYDVVMNKYSVCPFNTQNTFWTDPTTFYAMYLPVSVTFRYTDILRGVIALYQLWKNNKTIKFTFPTAVQKRNEHDLNQDFESEVSMYNTIEDVMDLLNKNKEASLIDIYSLLEEKNIVTSDEIETLTEWMKLVEE